MDIHNVLAELGLSLPSASEPGGNYLSVNICGNIASDLFVNVLKEKGNHSRSIFGVVKLPRNFCAGITCSLTLIN